MNAAGSLVFTTITEIRREEGGIHKDIDAIKFPLNMMRFLIPFLPMIFMFTQQKHKRSRRFASGSKETVSSLGGLQLRNRLRYIADEQWARIFMFVPCINNDYLYYPTDAQIYNS